ncbi:Putative Peptidoglycan O-acetyltransferase(Membrane bound O-acyl transferase, MBOAT,121-380) [Magnetospirillum sp. XM-1]|uniref:MBOAT family O-acyltransferase n=1 Tax=Magnetospirillum sp. XM-1 TaxID=1663591 RepID=UPI00073DFA2F|nr:MBOAT family protein [Magnetospirillum sp. XM-1]CUW38120.1 Putative Peptidoglycan O-acetyltransferase(Membrane bound O-acyl transferase, MBOAT,121-380) [Magnetospirillum sp. XM-1]
MLFNSAPFLFAFLPLALAGFLGIRQVGGWRPAMAFLTLASIVFYAWWNPAYAWPLAVSIAANFTLGQAIARTRDTRWGGWVLALGIALNLAFLGVFKYERFFAESVAPLLGLMIEAKGLNLPLGVSFFTFTQIAYLVDVRRKLAQDGDALSYTLFVTFFPHLIAGPIIHHKEMMPQFRQPRRQSSTSENLVAGLSLFAIGLFKKAVIADWVASYVAPGFSAAASGQELSLGAAWTCALAYTVQIYFDFSGYSDMAVGLARLFGIDLPVNFNSPYKATNIIEFWRRWHMTLSRFLRDYLYFPLGGGRSGPVRRHVNLMVVMALGGLWHGAAWTFVAWGCLHGLMLVGNHLWREVRPHPPGQKEMIAGWVLTQVLVIAAWVFFRAANFDAALIVLKGMAGLGGGAAKVAWDGLALSLALLAFCALAPNSQQILQATEPGLEPVERPQRFAWAPTTRWAWALAAMLAVSVMTLWRTSEFLYYQF